MTRPMLTNSDNHSVLQNAVTWDPGPQPYEGTHLAEYVWVLQRLAQTTMPWQSLQKRFWYGSNFLRNIAILDVLNFRCDIVVKSHISSLINVPEQKRYVVVKRCVLKCLRHIAQATSLACGYLKMKDFHNHPRTIQNWLTSGGTIYASVPSLRNFETHPDWYPTRARP